MTHLNKLIPVLFVFIFTLITSSTMSQETGKEGGTMKTMKGEVIKIYGDITKSDGQLNYKNAEGKRKSVNWYKLEWLDLGNRFFINYPTEDGGKDPELMELVLQDEKHRLFLFGSGPFRVYIFDMNGKLAEPEFKLYSAWDGAAKGNHAKVKGIVLKYFSKCDDLKSKMDKNDEVKQNLFEGIGYSDCGGAPDPRTLLK